MRLLSTAFSLRPLSRQKTNHHLTPCTKRTGTWSVKFSPTVDVKQYIPTPKFIQLNATYKKQNRANMVSAPSTQTSPKCGVLDTGATDHFMPMSYKGLDERATTEGIKVGCANGTIMEARATDILNIPTLPETSRVCHKFNEIDLPLVSGKKLADAGCTVIQNTHGAWVLNNKTGEIVLKGDMDTTKNLWTVPLQPDPTLKLEPKPELTKEILKLSDNTTTTSPRVIPSNNPLQIAASAYEKKAAATLLGQMHRVIGFPTKRTWIKALKHNNLVSWPGMYINSAQHTSTNWSTQSTQAKAT